MAVPPPLPVGDKAVLRRELRAARAAFVAALPAIDLQRMTHMIADRLADVLPEGGAVGGYVAQRGEPDVMPALLALHHAGRPIALPRVASGTAMSFVEWHPGAPLKPGSLGIAEPAGGRETAPETLLVPLVGFDRGGHRLGQGAGCYDRWLARHPGTRTIGVAWSAQEAAAIPSDRWDMPLDLIVTEAETIAP